MILWASFFALLVIGVPVAVTMGLSGMIALMAGTTFSPLLVAQRMFSGIDSFPLMAVPFFILAAEIMTAGRLTDVLLRFALQAIGPIRGGLGHANIATSVMFSGISGSALADAAGPGALLIRMMKRAGYDEGYAAGLTASAAIIAPIIPPSIIMIIYALADNSVTVGALFTAGILPGLMLAGALALTNHVLATRRGYRSADPRPPMRVFLRNTAEALPALALPVIILGGIHSGAFTPTEASAVAVFYALAVGMLVYRTVRVGMLPGILLRTALMTSAVLLIISMASVFAWLLAVLQIPQTVAATVKGMGLSQTGFLAFVLLLLLACGLVLDTLPAVIILVPILAPLSTQFGVDPIHFAMVVILNLTIGMVTPPVGAVLFVLSVVARIPMGRLVRGVLPFLLAEMAVLLLITFVPWFSTAVPHALGYAR
jgi:tripartite ATP-independent transporter DctM subunit